MTQPSLPSNVDAERATLGSVLLNRDALAAIEPWLRPEFFYLERHALIYDAMLHCFNARVPPDTRTVAEELRRRGQLDSVGGVVYLSELIETVPTSYHVEYYARAIERTATLRRLINTGAQIAALGYDEQRELDDTIDKAESLLFEISQKRTTHDFLHIKTMIYS